MPATNDRSHALDPGPSSCTAPDGGRPDIEAELPSGVRVEVRNRFDGAWVPGFQILAAQTSGGYVVRRISDRSVLPVTFAESELRLDPVPLPAHCACSCPPAASA
jgi:hypothetical protein